MSRFTANPSGTLELAPVFSAAHFLVFCVVFCRSSFVLFFIQTLYCLSFLDFRFLFTPFVSSNFSYNQPQSSLALSYGDVYLYYICSATWWVMWVMWVISLDMLMKSKKEMLFWHLYSILIWCTNQVKYSFWHPMKYKYKMFYRLLRWRGWSALR